MSKPDTSALFAGALGVWNRALDEHGDTPPYKQIVSACQAMLGDRKMGVEVYEPESDQVTGEFTIRIQDGRLVPIDYDQARGGPTWRVSEAYLQDVMKNADDYAKHPSKLEWNWLKDRIGLG